MTVITPPTHSEEIDELSTTRITAKTLLLEMRTDIKHMSSNVDILVSQNLDERLSRIEDWKERADGRANMLMVGLSVIGALVAILVALRVLTII